MTMSDSPEATPAPSSRLTLTTAQPPARVAVRRDRYASTDTAKVRGRVVGVAFDETGNLWAYAVLDDRLPLVSPFGVTEYGAWPMEGDELVAVVQGWNLEPAYMGSVRLGAGMPVFVYTQTLPEPDANDGGSDG